MSSLGLEFPAHDLSTPSLMSNISVLALYLWSTVVTSAVVSYSRGVTIGSIDTDDGLISGLACSRAASDRLYTLHNSKVFRIATWLYSWKSQTQKNVRILSQLMREKCNHCVYSVLNVYIFLDYKFWNKANNSAVSSVAFSFRNGSEIIIVVQACLFYIIWLFVYYLWFTTTGYRWMINDDNSPSFFPFSTAWFQTDLQN